MGSKNPPCNGPSTRRSRIPAAPVSLLPSRTRSAPPMVSHLPPSASTPHVPAHLPPEWASFAERAHTRKRFGRLESDSFCGCFPEPGAGTPVNMLCLCSRSLPHPALLVFSSPYSSRSLSHVSDSGLFLPQPPVVGSLLNTPVSPKRKVTGHAYLPLPLRGEKQVRRGAESPAGRPAPGTQQAHGKCTPTAECA